MVYEVDEAVKPKVRNPAGPQFAGQEQWRSSIRGEGLEKSLPPGPAGLKP
jgi:hypothetical protein